ncbi:Acetyltransferase (GNAT) domain-containing protein [Abditibacterium utsteinense]|uniref:Acetyltransferase (GNAT) domain-containing protein n=1 Tax=Abditibacterium utsteinense TaxID=1960156 RepID=A0A2S8SV50_9BACT|nr:GNAT family N-acetyltransferase [Abditibacterium utsteinense]PQV64675.1 Acetyltransferase (GNAT) domain-containing protein [Abditibacterium utsteinense]
MENILIQPMRAAQTSALRRAVLRPNQPPSASVYPADSAAGALHLGAFCAEEIVGIASIYPEVWPRDANFKAWRLRGMAVSPAWQGRGIGSDLVRACLVHVQAHGGELLWCNARTPAVRFYRALGFESVGEEFEVPEIGPHHLMRRNLP